MAKDPYRYFRIEAHELLEGLAAGLLELEKGTSEPRELLRKLLRQAHTLKGASRVVKRRDIADLAHELEDVLVPHREAVTELPRDAIDAALRRTDEIRGLVATLTAVPHDEPDARLSPSRPVDSDGNTPSIRVAIRDLDAVLAATLEAQSGVADLRSVEEELSRLVTRCRAFATDETHPLESREAVAMMAVDIDRAQRSFTVNFDRASRELEDLRERASALRLVPAASAIHDLERIVRDAASTVDKQVELHVTGADTKIDAHVLVGLRKALVHVVRNSIAHGIEGSARRRELGKPAVGRIDVSIVRMGHRVSIRCSDDGAGLDMDAIRRTAVARGLWDSEAAESKSEAAAGELLTQGGLSTSRDVTSLSGRGVGLETVRSVVVALGGELRFESEAGRGVAIELLVPVSLSSFPALAVTVGDTAALLPLDCVQQALRISRTDLASDAKGEHMVVDGVVLPFVSLNDALQRPVRKPSDRETVVIVESDGACAAVGVDRLEHVRDVVVQNIPRLAAVDDLVTGATLDQAGDPALVLSPRALVRTAAATPRRQSVRVRPKQRPVLVIDDSLTTRMLEQSILEGAGYHVDLAVSAEDALEKASKTRYGLFIVDVDMPGMNGFEFIARTRASDTLRGTPAILVTSRATASDKLRGKRVGARAFIVKSEFNQAELLETVRRLVE